MNPPLMPPSFQTIRDADHLRLLAIFHYVMAGFSCLGALFGAVYMGIGMFMTRAIPKLAASPGHGPGAHAAMPRESMWIFVILGGIIALISITMAVINFLSGRNLSARRHRTFCLVVAGINCVSFPLGTILGVFTILVLGRPTVEGLFKGEGGLAAPSW